MDIEKYRQYARSPEAFAVLFVKKYLKSADSSVWVSILSYESYDYMELKFKHVACELVPRRTRPAYPDRRRFRSDSDYDTACRAATWEAADRDIRRWNGSGRQGRRFMIQGVSYPKHRDASPGSRLAARVDPDRYFRPDAPPEIRALARNLNDRTDPLWDRALAWVSPEYACRDSDDDDGYVFRIRSVKRIS